MRERISDDTSLSAAPREKNSSELAYENRKKFPPGFIPSDWQVHRDEVGGFWVEWLG